MEKHQGIFDLSFLSHMPHMTIMAHKEKKELKDMLKYAVNIKGPVAIRYPKGEAPELFPYMNNPIEYKKAEILYEGEDAVFFAVGKILE